MTSNFLFNDKDKKTNYIIVSKQIQSSLSSHLKLNLFKLKKIHIKPSKLIISFSVIYLFKENIQILICKTYKEKLMK